MHLASSALVCVNEIFGYFIGLDLNIVKFCKVKEGHVSPENRFFPSRSQRAPVNRTFALGRSLFHWTLSLPCPMQAPRSSCASARPREVIVGKQINNNKGRNSVGWKRI